MDLGIIIIIILGTAGLVSAIVAYYRWKKLSINLYIDEKIVSKRRKYMSFTIAGMLLTLSAVLFIKFYYTEGATFLDLWFDASWSLGLLGYMLDSYYNASIVKTINGLCLYLRPFNIDTASIIKNKKSYVKGWFGVKEPVEKFLCNELNQRVSQTFSIGNPNSSLPATFATTNLYANDSEWKDAVAELSSKADVIVIRVGNSEGCQWELNHCAENHYLQKTVFLVEDGSMIDMIKSIIEEVGPISFCYDNNPRFIVAVFFDKQKGQWQAIELRSKRIVKKFVADYVENDSFLKNQASIQKKRDGVRQMFIKSEKVPGKIWQSLGFALNPVGYGVYNRWSKKWWLLFVAYLFIAYVLAVILSCFAYFFVNSEAFVSFESLTQLEQETVLKQLVESDSYWEDVFNIAPFFTVLLMIPWIWLAPNISWRNKKWGSAEVFIDRGRSFATWTILFLLFFFLFIVLLVL